MRFTHHIGPVLGRKSSAIQSTPRLLMVSPNSIELLKSLDVGDSLVGRVARVLDDARVVMNFRGVELVATTTVPLSAGAQIEGIVQTKGPPFVLRITSRHLSEKSKILVRFKSLAAQLLPNTKEHPVISLLKTLGITERDWAKPLTDWLEARALSQETASNPQRVWEALIHGGMFYERKIREWVEAGSRGTFEEIEVDLKGIALKLLNEIENQWKGEGPLSEQPIKALRSLVSKIELFQTGNWLAQKEGFGVIFQIPLRFDDNVRTATLFVGLSDSERRKRDGLRILLLLDLGELGRFQINVHLSQCGVTAAIGVDREETLAIVRSMKEELKSGFEGQGLTVVDIECFLLETPATAKDLFQELLVMDETEAINIRV